jgi:hypothetical protein
MQERSGTIGLTSGAATTRFGFSMYPTSVPDGTNYETDGTWAVTAP